MGASAREAGRRPSPPDADAVTVDFLDYAGKESVTRRGEWFPPTPVAVM